MSSAIAFAVPAQEPCLSLAFDYADHDLYEIIRYHRERLRGAPIAMYTIKSIMWQLLNGLSFMEQVKRACHHSCPRATVHQTSKQCQAAYVDTAQ